MLRKQFRHSIVLHSRHKSVIDEFKILYNRAKDTFRYLEPALNLRLRTIKSVFMTS